MIWKKVDQGFGCIISYVHGCTVRYIDFFFFEMLKNDKIRIAYRTPYRTTLKIVKYKFLSQILSAKSQTVREPIFSRIAVFLSLPSIWIFWTLRPLSLNLRSLTIICDQNLCMPIYLFLNRRLSVSGIWQVGWWKR